MKRTVCVCGGGNLGHVCAGFMAAEGDIEVRLLTRCPGAWHPTLVINRPLGLAPLIGRLTHVSDNPAEVVPGADIVLLCLPGYAIRQTLLAIRSNLLSGTAVGSVVSNTGFFFQAMEVLPETVPLFGLQRVPFIARTEVYGQSARLLGYKENLAVAVERSPNAEALRLAIECMFGTPVLLLSSHYEATLSNSNPLLHTSRLYDLWNNWRKDIVYPHVPLFYEEWTENAARLYIGMDCELQTLLERLPVRKGSVAPVLDYYQCADAASLATKLRNIKAFKGIPAPMKAVDGGYIPDFSSRYFSEDFPFGLDFIRRTAALHAVSTPIMDCVANWWRVNVQNESSGKPVGTNMGLADLAL